MQNVTSACIIMQFNMLFGACTSLWKLITRNWKVDVFGKYFWYNWKLSLCLRAVLQCTCMWHSSWWCKIIALFFFFFFVQKATLILIIVEEMRSKMFNVRYLEDGEKTWRPCFLVVDFQEQVTMVIEGSSKKGIPVHVTSSRKRKKVNGSGGIRTHAPGETGA